MKDTAICSKCRHSARGHAIDMRPRPVGIRKPGEPPIRSSLSGGDYICARNGLTHAKPDPVTGFVPLPSGPDCRDLNRDGACPDYQRVASGGEAVSAIALAALLVVAVGLASINGCWP